MKIKIWYSMGYSGTDTEWEEEVPQDVIDAGKAAIDEYIEETHQYTYETACEKISTSVTLIEEE